MDKLDEKKLEVIKYWDAGAPSYRWIEIALLLLGLVAAIWARQGSWLRGVGTGIVPQAAVMLILDVLAERRGQTYLDWLKTL